ncbi:uncharacterized protein LOC102706826 [Oryza brachyantha]|uniref:Uncharacterized protein n=1 Tax=Oryza brachyantha TaxID=4533 RepID=J3LSK0_ORYBR|nr:uncharacterized protein LOC102706826 [Oryza brachyantha]XP_040378299.1 uncharacterized protein LOC102706826 [Oryza brachyantha]
MASSSSSSSSNKLSLTFVVLLAGMLVLGEMMDGAGAADCSTVRCIQGGYITCKNYPGKKLDGCVCLCAPDDGNRCVLHLQDGSSYKCRAPN